MVMTPTRPDTRPSPQRPARKRGRWWPAAPAFVVTLGVMMAAFGVFYTVRDAHSSTPDTSYEVEPVRLRPAPHNTLTTLAAKLQAIPPPAAHGRYHITIEQWARSGEGISPRLLHRWRDDAGSGRTVTRVAATVDTSAFRPTMIGHGDFADAHEDVATFGAGGLAAPITDPSADSDRLLQQLFTHESASSGAPGVLRAVAALYAWIHPDISVRVAVLQVLARIDGLVIDDVAVDPLGRPGIAISATTRHSTDTLLIDGDAGLPLWLTQTYTVSGQPQAVHQHQVWRHSDRIAGRAGCLGMDRVPLGTPGMCVCGQPIVLDELLGWMHVKTDVTTQDLAEVVTVLAGAPR